MRILIFADRFIPEVTAVSFREMDHAKEWLKLGHEVTVVTCAPNFPKGKLFPGYKNRPYQEEWIDGVRVVRVWSYMTANEGTLKRTLDYMSFVFAAIFFFWRYPKFDAIIATSPPLFVAIAGWAVSRLRRRPWIFEVRDLWPATIEAVQASKKGSFVMRMLTRLEEFLYKHADRLVLVTDSFYDELKERGVPTEKMDVVTNGVDSNFFSRESVQFDAKEKLGLKPDSFLAAYIGTTGMTHGLTTMVEAAELCKDEPDIVFLIMGEGAERANLETEVEKRGLTNFKFHDFVPREEVVSYLGGMDASIVHLRPHPLFKTVIPSKIFETMAMGLPMAYGVEGLSAEIVRDANAGICYPSGDAQAMADAVKKLYRNPELRKQFGDDGRAAVEKHYSRRVKAAEMIVSIEKMLHRGKAAASPCCTACQTCTSSDESEKEMSETKA